MKTLSIFGSFLLIVTLSACGSGSSAEPDATRSTNATPALNNTTDSGTSSEPSNDQPSTAGGTDSTSGDTDISETDENGETDAAVDGVDAIGGSDSENDSDAGVDSAGSGDTDGGADTTNGDNTGGDTGGDTESGADTTNVSDADGGSDATDGGDTDGSADTSDGGDTEGAGETDGSSDSDNGADSSAGNDTDGGGDTISENGNTDTDNGSNTNPVIDPDSALGQLQSRINKLTGRTLIALNQSLSQGEMLSEQQEQCLGTYEPAIGEPLLSIDCEQPLATGEVPIFARIASLKDTPECRASLQNANADACAIDQAEVSISPIFTVPETGRPQLKQAGALLSYNIVQDRLTIENLTRALTGNFFCEYDLSNGNAVGGDQGGNCYNLLNRIRDLIDEHLAIEN